MIRFSHSVFALPFALASAALAAREAGVSARQVLWIVVAMVAARSAAMGFNRLVDHAIDARNPRTAGRELPPGVLSRGEAWAVRGDLDRGLRARRRHAEPAVPRALAGRPR